MPQTRIERKWDQLTEYMKPSDPDLASTFLFQHERKQPEDIVEIRKDSGSKWLAVFVYQDWLVT